MALFASLSKRKASRGAFTLVELLVVIGIIALLISILLPSLNKARKAANTIKCKAAMRQIGYGFLMYAGESKGAFPVVKYYTGSPFTVSYGNNIISTVQDLYWYNLVGTYCAPKALFGWYNDNLTTNLPPAIQNQINDQAGKSVIWGCPEWRGSQSTSLDWNAIETPYTNGRVSAFENGYTMNPYWFYRPSFPAITDTTDPISLQSGGKYLIAEWATDQFSTGNGTWAKQSQYTNASERAMVVETTLWLFGFQPTGAPNASGTLVGQYNGRILEGSSGGGPGSSNFDYYRHGAPDKAVPLNNRYAVVNRVPAGRVATNILYCDGHVDTVIDARLAYKSIRMVLP